MKTLLHVNYFEGKGRLQEFLDLALAWNLPAMLHIRDKNDSFAAGQDALDRLKIFAGNGGRFVIHCCTLPAEKISQFLDLGAMIGVTGMISFKRADNLREMLAKVPDDRLLLEGCMKLLSDQDRQIVVLHAVAGCTHAQIGKQLGLKTGTVLSKYHRAIRKLRQDLGKEESR